MMRLNYLPGQFSVFYLPSASNGAGQLKLGQHFVLRSEKWDATCDPEPYAASGHPPDFTLALESQ